ncbi:MAG: energy transducer TonB [Gammaproteobacteria bacterium]|nr:energy transducer TonB [Gammaproteobacteria bacterium]
MDTNRSRSRKYGLMLLAWSTAVSLLGHADVGALDGIDNDLMARLTMRAADLDTPSARPTDDPGFAADLQHKLELGEFAEVADEAQRHLAELEVERGRYDIALAHPLTLLGDARMRMDDPDGALEAYDRARYITRLQEGIQSVRQSAILYREARALAAIGDYPSANDRHEFAYDLSLRAYGRDDPRHMVATYRLIRWYRHHYKFLPTHLLFEQLTEAAKTHLPEGDPLTIAIMRAHARLFHDKVFGRRTLGRGLFHAWPPGISRPPPWRTISSFDEGRAILGEIVETLDAAPGTISGERATALLNLADWNLLFAEYPRAIRHYREVWNLLQSDPGRQQVVFSEPTPLFLPMPRKSRGTYRGWEDGEDPTVGLALTVNRRGKVTGRKTVHTNSDRLMEHRVRMAAKRARYRPAFRDGDPVTVRGFPLAYDPAD